MDYNKTINSDGVVLVEFYATWCPHCQRMMPVVDKVKELLNGQASVVQIDVDRFPAVAEEAQVDSMPTFILYKDGREVWRDTGEMDGTALYNRVEAVC